MTILRACPALEEFALRNMTDVDAEYARNLVNLTDERNQCRTHTVRIFRSDRYGPHATIETSVHFTNAGAERMARVIQSALFPGAGTGGIRLFGQLIAYLEAPQAGRFSRLCP